MSEREREESDKKGLKERVKKDLEIEIKRVKRERGGGKKIKIWSFFSLSCQKTEKKLKFLFKVKALSLRSNIFLWRS